MTSRRARFAIAAGLVGLAALGVLGELAARLVSPAGRRPLLAHYNPAVLPVRWFSLPDGARSYFYEPGREALHCFDASVGPPRPWDVLGKAPDGTPLGCVSYRISPRGFRESGLETAGEGRDPLLLVGDSFTFGEGVAVGQRVSEALARQLDARARRSYSVRNRGVQGMSLESIAALYRGVLRAERPRLVVLGIVPNDAQPWGETVGQNPFLRAAPSAA